MEKREVTTIRALSILMETGANIYARGFSLGRIEKWFEDIWLEYAFVIYKDS